jgi:hypothetical protein
LMARRKYQPADIRISLSTAVKKLAAECSTTEDTPLYVQYMGLVCGSGVGCPVLAIIIGALETTCVKALESYKKPICEILNRYRKL